MAAERALVLEAMKELAIELRNVAGDPQLDEDVLVGDGPRLAVIVARACLRAGLDEADYREAVAEDAELGELNRMTLIEVCCAADPGPYDVFSPRDPPGSDTHAVDEADKAPIG
jgi:hypothetical protein